MPRYDGSPVSQTANALLILTLLGAAWLVVHAMLLIRAGRSALGGGWRLLAWLPPATPLVGWRAGARVLPIAWLVLALAYVVMRLRAP